MGLNLMQRTLLGGIIPAGLALDVNNIMSMVRRQPVLPERTLLLLPSCLPDRLQNQLHVKAFNMGMRSYSVRETDHAGELIKNLQPEALVAVACPSKLASGIKSAGPLIRVATVSLRGRGCRGCHKELDVSEVLRKIRWITGR